MKLLPYILLAVGVGLAGAFGARNGPTHSQYRTANWHVQALDLDKEAEDYQEQVEALQEAKILVGDVEAGHGQALQIRDDIGLPAPEKRLMEWLQTGGVGFGFGIGLVLIGAVMARRQIQAEQQGTGKTAAEVVDFLPTMLEIRRRVVDLQVQLADLPMDDDAPSIRDELDSITVMLSEPLVDARGRFMARHGIAKFATYFGPYSAAERNLARCWSGLADGHAVVARQACENALDALEQAESAWNEAEKAA
jgi:hypothetical protein